MNKRRRKKATKKRSEKRREAFDELFRLMMLDFQDFKNTGGNAKANLARWGEVPIQPED